MTQYRLAALEWWQEVDHTETCEACGATRGERQVELVRHRQGDVVDIDGADEARLLAAGALAPLEDEPAEASDDDAGQDDEGSDNEHPGADGADTLPTDGDDGADTPPADTYAGDQPAEVPDTDGPVGTVESGLISVTEKPKQAANVAVWVEYAVTRGIDRAKAEDMTKRELIAEVG